jgi:4-amino-4-deoxy-L-arabinose transferase-like glycosyltransferase
LFIYDRTTVPGLLPGDGGEFQTLTYHLGNTHPTGYPIYLVTARLFAFLPLGDLAYRVNLFSAAMGALTVAGVYLCGRLLTGYRATAAAGALALAISPTLWSEALIAEVYTAGAVFMIFILLALFWWDRSNKSWVLFAASLLGGLSLGVHMSVALMAPAVLLFLLLHWRRGCRMWKTAVLGVLAGLAVTVLLFLLIDWNDPSASYFNSVIEPSRTVWGYEAGQIDDPLEHLLFGWQGRQFQYLMFANINQVMLQQAGDYWNNLENELAMPLILMAIVGAVWLLLRRSRVAALLLASLFFQLFTFFNKAIVLTNWDMMWPYYYAAHLESDRSDLVFVETFPADDQDKIADSLVEYVLDNFGEKPMFFESRISQLEEIDNISMGPRRVGPTRLFSVIEKEQ